VAPYVKAACFLKLLRGAKLPEQRPFCFLIVFFFFLEIVFDLKQGKTKKRKEERRKFFLLLILLLPYFFFFFILLVIYIFSYWDFFSPLPWPMSSFVRVGSFLPYLCFVTIHAPWQGRQSWGHSHCLAHCSQKTIM
jgi:polyferredoxin